MARRLCLTLALAATAGCSSSSPAPSTDTERQTDATAVAVSDADAAAAGIETVAAKRVDRTEPIQAAGVVGFDERRTARLGSVVAGVVNDIPVQVGDRVTRGAVLARVHSHVVHEARAGYLKALAEERRLDAELAYARAAEARASQLVADKALSPQELQRARTDVEAASHTAAASHAERIRAEQELEHYGIPAEPTSELATDRDLSIRSPLDGTVVERLVAGGTALLPGTPLFVISDLQRVWVTAEVDEQLIARLTPGREATVAVAAYPGETFAGVLTAIGDIVNAESRRVTLRVETANRDRRLKPQMFATVTLSGVTARAALVIPSDAIQTIAGEQVVFVRAASGRFERRVVRTASDVDGSIEVISGLREGEDVAARGAFLLKSELLTPTVDEEP